MAPSHLIDVRHWSWTPAREEFPREFASLLEMRRGVE